MIWYLFAILCALSLATTDALTKKAMGKNAHHVIAWVRIGYAIPFLLITAYYMPLPDIKPGFWTVVIIALPLEITAYLLYMKAISCSPLSLTIPFLAFTPVFLIITSFIVLGEIPDTSGFAGIIMVTSGAYLLHARKSKSGILEPIKAIFKEKGSLYMLIVAFIYSITSALGKRAVLLSGPVFFTNIYFILLATVLFIIIKLRTHEPLSSFFYKPLTYIPIGLFFAASIILHFQSIKHINASYMISLKRLSIMFSVIYGKLLFHEENIKERITGCVIMIIGVLLITVF